MTRYVSRAVGTGDGARRCHIWEIIISHQAADIINSADCARTIAIIDFRSTATFTPMISNQAADITAGCGYHSRVVGVNDQNTTRHASMRGITICVAISRQAADIISGACYIPFITGIPDFSATAFTIV